MKYYRMYLVLIFLVSQIHRHIYYEKNYFILRDS